MRTAVLALRRVLIAVVLLVVTALAVVYVSMRASLAPVDGERVVAGLAGDVVIERDAAGVVTLNALSRNDLFFAEGYVHAQERFFQMDLTRRTAAGELAELFGARAVAADRRVRAHGFRLLAGEVFASLSARRQRQLETYAAGVNAGLADLSARPPEYFVIGVAPRPWRPADSVLVSYAMYLDLNDHRALRDGHRALLQEVLPVAAYAWLTADGSPWDAPLAGESVPPPPLPGERWFDAPSPGRGEERVAGPQAEEGSGSNSWAVSGALTATGAAMLANDMHLGLRVPNIWFRARLRQSGPEGELDAIGVTLPGIPGLVVGSNGHIAWGFTNSYGDWSDRVILRTSREDAGVYRVASGSDRLRLRSEVIVVKGDDDVEFDVPMSRFGPLIGEDRHGRPVALRWLAHERAATNFELLDMLDVTEVDSALALANRCGLPPQNIVVAGSDGRIGWSIAGRIPKRVGYDPRLPRMSDEDAGWRGWLAPADYPRHVNPPGQRIWTANARVAALGDYAIIGRGDYPLGARARQIRDRLFARERFDETDMLAIQLDDRGLFLQRWRTLMMTALTPGAVNGHPGRAALARTLSAEPELRASVASTAYRAVRQYRARVESDLLGHFVAPAKAVDPDFNIFWLSQREAPLWQTVATRPARLLPPGHASWDAYFLHHIDGLLEEPDAARQRSWGDVNRARISHPLAAALPGPLARRLNMPEQSLPGDAWMPRVQSPSFGASERLVVSPGHEQSGLFHMPGGQSGHPLSPFYAGDHDAWARGEATALLPGQTRYRLILRPEAPAP